MKIQECDLISWQFLQLFRSVCFKAGVHVVSGRESDIRVDDLESMSWHFLNDNSKY